MRNLAAMEIRIRNIEKMMGEIYAVIMEVKLAGGADEASILDRLCREAVKGNRLPLDEYCRRIGKQAGKAPACEAEGEAA